MKHNSDYIITKIIDNRGLAKRAQVGVDLTINSLEKITGGSVLRGNGKMELSSYHAIPPVGDPSHELFWELSPGAYAIEFDQGLRKLGADENAYIVQRSSLNRAGVLVRGSVYDPGFETEKLGATMYVSEPITIYRHARVAQILISTNRPVGEEDQYKGTWQGKANR